MSDVSVVIPTYERDETLERAIDSVLEQTVAPERVVVVDDGSSFDTTAYIDERFDSDRIDVLVHDANRGASAARNTGLQAVETTYVAFLDSDDHWHPEKLERQLERADETGAELVYCDQWVVDESGDRHPSGKRLVEDDIRDALLSGWTAPNTSTLLFETATLRDVGGFDTDLPSCQDHDLWMRIALADVDVAVVREPLSYFTQDAANRISTDATARLAGARAFTSKWREDIVDARGRLHHWWFRWAYLVRVSVPIVEAYLSSGRYLTATVLALRTLLLNPAFYVKGVRYAFGRVREA